MARAAGNDSHYVWQLRGREGECDIRLPSVTSIIKAVMSPAAGGMAWWGAKLALEWAGGDYDAFKKSDKNPNAARDKAGGRGTQAHDYLEELATSGVVPTPTTGYEYAIKDWWMEQMPGWQIEACEIPVYSLRHGYAGTVDLVRKHISNGITQVIDLKTHKGPARIEDHIQVAAYNLALEEMGIVGKWEVEHSVLLAREDGSYEVSNRWVNPEVFLKIRDVYEEVSK